MSAELKAEIDRVRASGVIGRRGRLVDLFEYLAKRTLEERPPKEAEIAADVFGRSVQLDAEDASIRVYIHRLRKKLEEFYLREGDAGHGQLILPRGDYAFVLERAVPVAEADAMPAQAAPARWLWGVLAACLVVILVQGVFLLRGDRGDTRLEASPVFSPLADRSRPLLIALGDYYIFGEYQDGLFLDRLIRDFEINSSRDLTDLLLSEPELMGTYVDVSLGYLPTSTAQALNALSPVFASRSPQIVMASELTEEQTAEADIVYIGLTSGLGPLQAAAMQSSRFQLGRTFDEILDTEDETDFISDAFQNAAEDLAYRDFALFSVQAGDGGNLIWIMAGTRDAGLIGLTDFLSDEARVSSTLDQGIRSAGYEAVFAVSGEADRPLSTRLIREEVD